MSITPNQRALIIGFMLGAIYMGLRLGYNAPLYVVAPIFAALFLVADKLSNPNSK